LKSENLIIIPNKITEILPSDKKIIMVINESENNDSFQDVLKNMAKALKMDFENHIYLLVLADEEKCNISQPIRAAKALISFGVDASRLSLQIEQKPYKIYTLGENRIIITDKISLLDKQRKMVLWQLLQQIFPAA
jgi:hypothetical protein